MGRRTLTWLVRGIVPGQQLTTIRCSFILIILKNTACTRLCVVVCEYLVCMQSRFLFLNLVCMQSRFLVIWSACRTPAFNHWGPQAGENRCEFGSLRVLKVSTRIDFRKSLHRQNRPMGVRTFGSRVESNRQSEVEGTLLTQIT